MATYWASPDNGDAGNDGSQLFPWDTLGRVNSNVTLASGDIVNLYGGIAREKVDWTGNLTGVTIQQVPGAAGYEQRGSILIASELWSVSDQGFTANIGASLLVRGFSWKYGVSTTATGSRYGFCVQQTSLVGVNAPGKYFYDSSTGDITTDVGEEILGGDTEYAVRGTVGKAIIQFNNMTNCVVSGIRIGYGPIFKNGTGVYGATLATATEGQYNCGIAAATCTNTTWTNLTLDFCGNHSTLMSGGNLSGNRVSGNTYYGCSDGGILQVFYSDTNSTGGNEASDNKYYPTWYLNMTGTAQVGSVALGVGSILSHTDSFLHTIDNLTYRRNSSVNQFSNQSAVYTCANATAPSDGYDWTTYSIKFIGCTITGGTKSTIGSANCAHVNCDYNYSDASGIGDNSPITHTAETIGYFGCVLSSNTPGSMINCAVNSAEFYAISNTVINRDVTGANVQYAFLCTFTIGTINFYLRGNLCSYTRTTGASRRFTGGGATSTTASNNGFFRHDVTTGDSAPTLFPADPFLSMATGGALSPTGMRFRHSFHPKGNLQGINRKRYVGNFGAYQIPAGIRSRVGGASRRGTGPR